MLCDMNEMCGQVDRVLDVFGSNVIREHFQRVFGLSAWTTSAIHAAVNGIALAVSLILIDLK